jgi:pyruvate kinase
MIARGDLGVELPPQNVPVIQKRAIVMSNLQGKISITATQMLDSMQENPRPTRAEASDVANAILDGTDAVMLSGETATGKYPIEAVKMMANIITEIEGSEVYRAAPSPDFIPHMKTFPNAVAKAATVSADELDVLGIVVLTLSGATARMMMTYRPSKPIIACTPSDRVSQQMAAYWGVSPHKVDIWSQQLEEGLDSELTHATQDALDRIEDLLRHSYRAQPGDEVIVVMGFPIDPKSETNLLKFHRISNSL